MPLNLAIRSRECRTLQAWRARFAVTALGLLSSRFAHAEACVPGYSSPAALEAEENRREGEAHLATARRADSDPGTRALELGTAEKQFRAAADATPCVVPLNVVRLAETLELEGCLVAALAMHRRVLALRSELAKYAIYKNVLNQSERAEKDLTARVVNLELVVRAPGCQDPVALVDGARFPNGRVSRDPGVVRIEVAARGCQSQYSFYTLREGANIRLELSLERTRAAALPKRPKEEPVSWWQTPTLGLPRWAWVSVGGVALAAGGYASYRLLSPSSSAGNAQCELKGTLECAYLR